MSFSRRSLLLSSLLMGGVLLAGCSAPSGSNGTTTNGTANGNKSSAPASSSSTAAPAVATSVNNNAGSNNPGPMVNGVSTAAVSALVEGASHGNARVDHIFAGPDGMLGAVTVDTHNNKAVVFVSGGGKVVFPSGGFTADGKNVVQQYLVSEHVYIAPQDLANKVKDLGFVVGKSGPIVTIFDDPNCYWCHKFFENYAPAVDAGKMRLRVLMVGVIKPDSKGRAVSILAAKDKWTALKNDELKFDEKSEEGSAPILKESHPDLEAQIASNVNLMSTAGPVSTPGLLYCAKNGPSPTYINGAPQDVNSFLGGLSSDGPSCN